MMSLEELVTLYIAKSKPGKAYCNLAGSLKTWASLNHATTIQEALSQWIHNGVRKTTSHYSIRCRLGFANSFMDFARPYCDERLIPFLNKDRQKPKHKDTESEPLLLSPTSDLLGKYIAYQRAASAMSNSTHQCLRFFNNHCADQYPDSKELTQEMVMSWCSKRETENASSFNKRIAPIRSFLKYIRKCHGIEIALPEYLPYDKKKFVPHAFTEDELISLFDKADCTKKETHNTGFSFRIGRMTFSVILRFLYSTGLRTCEARLLNCEDVNLQEGVINISKSKGINEHRVALHRSIWDLLIEYDKTISRYLPNRTAFFSNEYGEHLSRTWLPYHFGKVWSLVSNDNARIYDFRSNYAVTNINKWRYVGPEWFDKLLYLSRSMGHTNIESTAYYYNSSLKNQLNAGNRNFKFN